MFERVCSTLYWPNFRANIFNYKAASSLSMPPVTPETPIYPFESICADFFAINSRSFLAIIDRFSNWLSVFQLEKDASEELLKILGEYFAIFGIPITFISDGTKVFTSKSVEDFLQRYGVIHRVTTA